MVSPQDYLRTTYDPDMEYVDGQLLERHVGEYEHSRLQTLIVMLLGAREREKKFRVLTEQRVRVSAQPKYRIPDVCVVALPFRREPVLTHPPHLAIEIVSREDETADILAKVADYLKAGIPHVWIADPYKCTLQAADRESIRYCTELVAETDLVGSVDFNQLFAQLEEPTD